MRVIAFCAISPGMFIANVEYKQYRFYRAEVSPSQEN